MVLNLAAVISNLDKGVSDIVAYFETIYFLPVESGPVSFDTFLLLPSSYPPRDEYFPY